MRITPLLVAISMCCGMNTIALAHQDSIPDDYPSHKKTDGCTEPGGTADLQQKLQEYNVTRVQVADVLYAMVDSYKLEGEVRKGLLGFAELFEQMGKDMPQPNPDSDEFRNFDFKLGLSLTAVTVYLNTSDESLTRRFQADQKNPDTVLGRYLTELDHSRDTYMAALKSIHKVEKTGACF